MLTTRGRSRAGLGVLAVAATALASCGGGGGQLAEQDASSTTSRAVNAPIPTRTLATPRNATAAAHELTQVESGLRSDDRDPARLDELGMRQQLVYRALAVRPAWRPHVLRSVPARLRAAVEANLDAESSLAALTGSGGGTPPATLPDWQVLAPQRASTLRRYYDEAQAVTGTPWEYLAAIHLVESRMGRIHGTSTAGAQGPMQFIPATWDTFGAGDITDDHDAIQAAGRYLASRGAPDDMAHAVFSYNNDDRYVAAIEDYARVLRADPRAYDGYRAWQVFVTTQDGTFVLPEGFGTP